MVKARAGDSKLAVPRMHSRLLKLVESIIHAGLGKGGACNLCIRWMELDDVWYQGKTVDRTFSTGLSICAAAPLWYELAWGFLIS